MIGIVHHVPVYMVTLRLTRTFPVNVERSPLDSIHKLFIDVCPARNIIRAYSVSSLNRGQCKGPITRSEVTGGEQRA